MNVGFPFRKRSFRLILLSPGGVMSTWIAVQECVKRVMATAPLWVFKIEFFLGYDGCLFENPLLKAENVKANE
jgi:hypothetical protein